MTAAYTDDPTIVQEQKTDKKIAVAATTTPCGNKQPGTREEEANIVVDNTEESRIMPKLATGGQDKEEYLHPVDPDRITVSCVSIDFTESHDGGETGDEILEKKEPLESPESSFEVLEKGQSPVGSKNCEITRDNVDARTENKVGNVDHDSDASSREIAIDDAHFMEEESRDAVSNSTRVDPAFSRTSSSKCVSTDASKMQLRELRCSLENIELERKDAASDCFEALESFVVVESAFSRYTSEEAYDPESELNFHEAVRAGDTKCVAALLTSGSVQNLDEPDWNVSGDPPLLVAATNHCLPVLSLLLANGCDPAVRSPRGETALHRVILNGGPGNVFKFVEELLKYGCPPSVKEAGGGLTALHVLTRQLAHAQGSKNLHHNFEAALKTLDLLAHAGPVNAKDHQGRSALHILASSTIFDNNHRTEIESLIETLLAAGADPALKNDRGETPLHECLECGALNTAFLLIPHTPTGITSRYGETPLHIASRKNYVDMVAKLLEHGEDPSVQDAGGNTPLHLASARGFHQTVSLLVTSPLAQLEKLNIEGLTALQVAAESGFVNAVKLLLKAGADPSQTVHYCTTTLHRHPDISVLIDHELSRRRQLAA